MRQWQAVATFGGGLNFSVNPAALEDAQWGQARNFRPDQNSAVTSPAYELVLDSSYTFTPDQEIIAILPNPLDLGYPLLIYTIDVSGAGPAWPVHLYKSRAAAGQPLVEIPWDGVGTRVTYLGANGTVQQAFLNGWLVFTVGCGGDTGFSMGQWNGTGNWATITGQKTSFRCAHLASFAGHLVAACVGTSPGDIRTLRISDANSTTVWTPDISNSADFGTLDDAFSGINALALLQANALGIFTRVGIYGLAPSGNIPPFTRTYIGAFGATDGGQAVSDCIAPWADETPYGVVFASFDNIYLGPGQAIGTAIYRAFSEGGPSQRRSLMARLLWHSRWSSVFVPAINWRFGDAAGTVKQQIFLYNTANQGWGTVDVPGADPPFYALDHAMFLTDAVSNPYTDLRGSLNVKHAVLHTDGSIWVEREMIPTSDPRVNYVESKDFALPEGRYVVAVKVDWEAITAGTALTVQCVGRDQLDWQGQYPSLGAAADARPGYYIDLSPVFDALGPDQQCTLAQGQSEAPLNVRGKWIRFRFSHTGGSVRIRGFAFASVATSDRTSSPDPSGTVGTLDRRHTEWDRDDLDIGEWE